MLTDEIINFLKEKNTELVRSRPLASKEVDYADASKETAKLLSSRKCEQGVLFCNTGTGLQ